LETEAAVHSDLHGDEAEQADNKNRNAKYSLRLILHATASEHQDARHSRNHDADKF